ncbi:MAG: DUF4214 domain-containing protein [Acidimicrobiales bacterium]|nr:DUF4214 domain-containing protein [Acidimicrobiales bacterium]
MSDVERALASRIAQSHNDARADAGLEPLREFDALAPYAGVNGDAMRANGELSHSRIMDLLDHFPRNMWAAENSLVMFNPAPEAVELWSASEAHAANIMTERASHIWVDVRCAHDGRMWVTAQYIEREVDEADALPGADPGLAWPETADLRCPVAIGPFESADDFVAQQYADFLGRDADRGGLEYWVSMLNTRQAQPSEVILAFLNSGEFAGRIRPHAERALATTEGFPTTDEVDRWRQRPAGLSLVGNVTDVRAEVDVFMIYVGMLDRAPDSLGFDYWTDLADEGVALNALVDGFLHSPEYGLRVS